MPANIDFEKDAHEKGHEKIANVVYQMNPQEQNYHNECGHKDIEKRCYIKYHKGAGVKSDVGSKLSQTSLINSQSQHKSISKKCKAPASPKKTSCEAESTTSTRTTKSLNATEIAAKCYDRKIGKKHSCTKAHKWQYGEYCRDDCGSGIVAKKFDFLGSRKFWCKTPLSLYQATVGELGRKILCREEVVPRDVKPGPPCNMHHDILPLCGGYYRKYECLRPCEEEYATMRNGKKQYRNKIERYWEPCQMKGQKFQLDVNEYAPQNAVLMQKLRRFNVDGTLDVPCW